MTGEQRHEVMEQIENMKRWYILNYGVEMPEQCIDLTEQLLSYIQDRINDSATMQTIRREMRELFKSAYAHESTAEG